MKIGKEIALEAIKHGLCDKWYKRMLKTGDYRALCEMFFDGDDWAMEKDFPSAELARKHQGAIKPYGLLMDYEGVVANRRNIAFLGNSHADFYADGYNVAQLYARHNSIVSIRTKGNAKVFINVLDSAKVNIIASEDSFVSVFKYSDSCEIETVGNVSVTKTDFKG